MNRSIVLIIFLLCLSGCSGIIDNFNGNDPLPVEATNEIAVLKATLTTPVTPLPEILEIEVIENSIPLSLRSAETSLHFIFSPRPLYDVDRSLGEYYFSFSQQVDEEFILLRTYRFSDGGSQERFYLEAFLLVPNLATRELPDIGDLVVEGQPVWIPVDATHVELRFRPENSSSLDLVDRYDLNNFEAYRRYFLPFIEASR